MRCVRCLYPDTHPLGITFDDQGLCSGCAIHEEKDLIDWAQRWADLQTLVGQYRSQSGRNYDCVVPVSGARDSFFIIHVVVNLLKLNPLCVTYNSQYNTATGARNLAKLRKCFDVDLISMTVDPVAVKKITRATLRRLGSVHWHCIAGQTTFPVQIATRMKIPLIIWGAHQGIDQVGMFSHHDEVEMTRRYRHEHDLMGLEPEDLACDFDQLSQEDLETFRYPDDDLLARVGVRGIYLNNFLRWDSKSQHEEMIRLYGFESALRKSTFDYYRDIDSWIYNGLHDYLKVVKHGYGSVLDAACRDIRLGHLTRSQALQLISESGFLDLSNIDAFLDWIGMSLSGLQFVVDQHRNPLYWSQQLDGNWVFSDPLSIELKAADKPINLPRYKLTQPEKSSDRDDRFILFGRGVA